jgi:hypothetical protein
LLDVIINDDLIGGALSLGALFSGLVVGGITYVFYAFGLGGGVDGFLFVFALIGFIVS